MHGNSQPDRPTIETLKRCHASLLECMQSLSRPYLNPEGKVMYFKTRNEVRNELSRLEFRISKLQANEVTADA